jgi:drug/metabolite transporter (DMT)-like permease
VDTSQFISSYGGMAASLGAALLWSISVSVYRIFGVGRSASWLNLYKGLIAMVCLGVMLLFSHDSVDMTPAIFWTLTASGVVGGLIGDTAFFAALFRIGATLTSTLQSLVPSITALLAYIFLGQTLNMSQMAGLLMTSGCLAGLLFFEAQKSHTEGHESDLKFGLADDGASDSMADRVKARRRRFYSGVALAVVAAISQAVGAVIARPVLGHFSPFLVSAIRLWLPVVALIFWEARKIGSMTRAVKGIFQGPGLVVIALGSFAGTFLGLTLMMYGMAHAPLGVAFSLNSTYPIWILLGERIFGGTRLRVRASLLVLGSVSGIWLMI